MNQFRELLRAEIKSTTYHRREAKARAKKLFRLSEYKRPFIRTDKDVRIYSSIKQTATTLQHDRAAHARNLNIASGLIRGLPYKSIEAKCRFNPVAMDILGVIKNNVEWRKRGEWTIERVKELLGQK